MLTIFIWGLTLLQLASNGHLKNCSWLHFSAREVSAWTVQVWISGFTQVQKESSQFVYEFFIQLWQLSWQELQICIRSVSDAYHHIMIITAAWCSVVPALSSGRRMAAATSVWPVSCLLAHDAGSWVAASHWESFSPQRSQREVQRRERRLAPKGTPKKQHSGWLLSDIEWCNRLNREGMDQ